MKTGKLVQHMSGAIVVEVDGSNVMIPMRSINQDNAKTVWELWQEIRTLRWKAKNLGKQLGKSGETIHALRAEIALLREAVRMASYPQRWIAGDNPMSAETHRALSEEHMAAQGKTSVQEKPAEFPAEVASGRVAQALSEARRSGPTDVARG